MLDDSLAMPGVPNFIAFEGVPLVFAKFGSAIEGDFCRLVRCREARQGLASEGATTHSLAQLVACPEELSHEAPRGASLLLLPWQTAPRSPGPRSPRSTPQEARDDGLVSHAADKEAVSRLVQHKTREQVVDYVCAAGTEHQRHTDALSQQLVHQEWLCAMQQAQLQQLKRKCELSGRELVQAKGGKG